MLHKDTFILHKNTCLLHRNDENALCSTLLPSNQIHRIQFGAAIIQMIDVFIVREKRVQFHGRSLKSEALRNRMEIFEEINFIHK